MENKNKNESAKIEALKEKLLYERKNVCKIISEAEIKKADEFCGGYKNFLDKGKTEREACAETVRIAGKSGFAEYEAGKKYKPGDKVYRVNRGKAVIFAVMGKNPVENGINIIAAHIDSPRVDLKQNPLFEDKELVYFKTHYYGGIKKYQWTAIPLALHGIVVKRDGSAVSITIGEDESDPLFTVTDLLPHLAENQYKRSAKDIIKGEELNLLIGSRPFKDGEDSASAKLAIMKILNDKYGITERDFVSAELEAVPAFKSRDIGLDRSIVGGYGHDDRACAYAAFSAILKASEAEPPERTAVCVLADKEEIGSFGNTGLGSKYLEFFIADLAGGSAALRRCLTNSKCISADVCAAFDPTFPDVLENNNAAFINGGATVVKYCGSRGKSGTNDANAEFVGEICRLFDENEVIWQTGELGKVDMGGGGTVSVFLAGMNINTVDVGVPVLSMHSPFELVSKADVYMTYKGFKAFYKMK
jgi:aspartyl aminopeptidase